MENTETIKSAYRDKWPDLAKFMAVLAVILYHLLDNTIMPKSVFNTLWVVLFTLHTPTFFMLAGFFLNTSLIHRCKGQRITKEICLSIIKEKACNVLLVAVIWTILYTPYLKLISLIFSSGSSWYDCSVLAFHHMWFFFFLFTAYFVSVAVSYVHISPKIVLPIIIICFIIASFYSRQFSKLLLCILVFEIGFYFGNFVKKAEFRKIVLIIYLFLIIAGCASGFIDYRSESNAGIQLLSLLLLKLPGCFVLPCIAFLLTKRTAFTKRKEMGKVLMIGRHSKEIYIIQFLFIAIYNAMDSHDTYVIVPAFIICSAVSVWLSCFVYNNRGVSMLFMPGKELMNKRS